MVCDFESFIVPVHADEEQEEEDECGTRVIDEHSVSGFCCYRVTPYEQHQTPPFVYSGPDVVGHFYEHVMQESSTISSIIRDKTDMLPMKEEDCERYERATRCGNCDKLFTPNKTKFVTIATLPETSYSHVATLAICN